MKRIAIGAAIAGIFAVGSLTLASAASAAPLGGSPAGDTVNQLQSLGYNVQLNLNGTRDVPLSECLVTGVHGLPNTSPVGQPAPSAQLTTVYLDVNCPPDN